MKRIAAAIFVFCCLLISANANSEEKKIMVDIRSPAVNHLIFTYICINECRTAYCKKDTTFYDCATEFRELLKVQPPNEKLPDEYAKDPVTYHGPVIIDPNKTTRAEALGFYLCLNSCTPGQ